LEKDYAAPMSEVRDDGGPDRMPAKPLSGREAGERDVSVQSFWRWGFSDLRENIARGILAEFLVAQAVGDPGPTRHAWQPYDVITPAGTKIVVQSSACRESWRQNPSRITFSGFTGEAHSDETTDLEAGSSLSANAYVFALHICREPGQYDVLDLDAWEFYPVPVETFRAHGFPNPVSKAFLDGVGAEAVDLAGLAEAITAACHESE
jgi:hypothetical protein